MSRVNSSIYHKILNYLCQTIDGTEWAGKVYAVGGCCRDLAMGHEIKDIDLAVEIPDGGVKFARWLDSMKKTIREPIYYPMFGTAMLSLDKYPDVEIEIVQTRSGKYTRDNRECPETVFGDIKEDCNLRDLTINSLYYNVTTGETLDITGLGISDIENRILRTPASPDETYTDDPLRVLRTIRFATRLGWDIDRRLMASMCIHSANLLEISPRRLGAEMVRILTGPDPRRAMELLVETGAIKTLLPELTAMMQSEQTTGGEETVWEHTIKVLEATEPIAELRLAALFHDCGKPRVRSVTRKGSVVYNNHEATSGRTARRWMKSVKMGRETIETVEFIIRRHDEFKYTGTDLEGMTTEQLLEIVSSSGSRKCLELYIAFVKANNSVNGLELQNESLDIQIKNLFKKRHVRFMQSSAQAEHAHRRRRNRGRSRDNKANKSRGKGYQRRRNKTASTI